MNFLPSISFVQSLSTIDVLVIFAGVALTYGASFWGATWGDQLWTARKLSLPLFVCTLVATWYGGIFGVTEIAFKQGIYNFITQGVFWYVAYIVFAFFLAETLASSSARSIDEFVGLEFGPRAQKVAALFSILNVVPVAYVLSLGTLIQMLTGLELGWCMVLGSMFMLSYTAFGGFGAVVYSDVVQCISMCTAVALVIYFSFVTIGNPLLLQQYLPSTHFSLTGGESLLSVFSWGLIALTTMVDPCFYQRCFASNSKSTAKIGILIATLIWFVFDICTTLGAMYAAAAIPTAEPRTAYITYAVQLLPDGLRGFFIFGIVSLILSTMDSFVHVGATMFSGQISTYFYRNQFSEKTLHLLAQVLILVAAISLALLYKGSFKAIWKSIGSFAAVTLLVPLSLLLILNFRVSERRFIMAACSSVPAMMVWNIVGLGTSTQIEGIYIGLMTSLGICTTSGKWLAKINALS